IKPPVYIPPVFSPRRFLLPFYLRSSSSCDTISQPYGNVRLIKIKRIASTPRILPRGSSMPESKDVRIEGPRNSSYPVPAPGRIELRGAFHFSPPARCPARSRAQEKARRVQE